MRIVFYLYFLLFASFSLSAFAQDEDLVIESVSKVRPWTPQLNQEVKIQVSMPKGFHAYSDQFKILNILPQNFKGGSISASPEIEFYDKYTNKNRRGVYEKGSISIVLEAPEKIENPLQIVTFDLRYQICSDHVCYLPKTVPIHVDASAKVTTGAEKLTAPIKQTFSIFKSIDELLRSNMILAFLSVFIAGILTSFTPCIFPMLPITISILGYHADKHSRFKNFSRSLAYVLGIALTYSTLGVIAAMTGSLFGSMLTNKYVLAGLVILFFAMALSMWGAYEIQSPAFIRNKLGTGKSHGLGGAFVMGLVAGIVASPCVGPVLVSILTYVSTTKNILLGFSLLFTFAFGLGLLFIIIGLFSSALKLLPKSGVWMDGIKFILGAGMWGAALYYSQFILPNKWWIILISVSFIGLSIWKGAFNFNSKRYILRSFLLANFIFSSLILIVSLVKPEYIFNNLYREIPSVKSGADLNWAIYSDEVLIQAQKESKPVMLDFYAEWCAACHELAEKTFSTNEFKDLSKQFLLVKFDATEDNEQIRAVLQKYDVKGLPTVIFINRNGDVLTDLTFTQFLTMDELRPKMQEAVK
jgi:thiol:disulfide interchange protein DsbD